MCIKHKTTSGELRAEVLNHLNLVQKQLTLNCLIKIIIREGNLNTCHKAEIQYVYLCHGGRTRKRATCEHGSLKNFLLFYFLLGIQKTINLRKYDVLHHIHLRYIAETQRRFGCSTTYFEISLIWQTCNQSSITL